MREAVAAVAAFLQEQEELAAVEMAPCLARQSLERQIRAEVEVVREMWVVPSARQARVVQAL